MRRRRPSTAVRLERQRDSAITATSRGCRRSSGSVGLGERNAVQLGERLELGPQPPPPHVAARFGAAASPVFRKELGIVGVEARGEGTTEPDGMPSSHIHDNLMSGMKHPLEIPNFLLK